VTTKKQRRINTAEKTANEKATIAGFGRAALIEDQERRRKREASQKLQAEALERRNKTTAAVNQILGTSIPLRNTETH